MNILYERSFLKDLRKIKDKNLLADLARLIEDIKAARELSDVKQVSRLKGNDSAYRIRFGHYRVGFFLEKETIILSRVLHRKEIYRYFP